MPGSEPANLKEASPSIDAMLTRLRSKIRAYVAVEGVAWSVTCLIGLFWLTFLIDYLPVRFGGRELSLVARQAVLVVTGILVAWVLYRFVFQRLFAKLRNVGLATLVERSYPEFNDSLLTTVHHWVSKSNQPADARMLERTQRQAEAHVPHVDLSKVLNSTPVAKSVGCGTLGILSLLLLGVLSPNVLGLGVKRVYLLSDQAWPRQCRIEVLGIKVERQNPVEGIEEIGKILKPVDGEFRVARGANLTLMVQAESDEGNQTRRLPSSCSLIYQVDGEWGNRSFKRIGSPRDGYQLYSIDGQPLSGMLADVEFQILGGDHRVGPFRIRVVDEPDVVASSMDCQFPSYMVDEDLLLWTDRNIEWTGQARLPQGTTLTVRAKSNKTLDKVYALQAGQPTKIIEPSGREFQFDVPSLKDSTSVRFFLCDTDGVVAENPHTMTFQPIDDRTPSVETRLIGIGTAVTPDVRIPVEGSVSDDYGLDRTWIEIEIGQSPKLEEELEPGLEGEIGSVVDFRQRRQTMGEGYQLQAGPDSTLGLVVKAVDKFDLGGAPNMGVGNRYVVDVVTSNELIRILERAEVGQRRRLEQIYLELVDAKNYLIRSKSKSDNRNELVEPGESSVEPGEVSSDEEELRANEMRLLFSQRAILQNDKSSQEILGCAAAFDNIRLQLINNRIDTEDRKKRFTEQIIGPLRLIGGQSMQQLRGQIVALEKKLKQLQARPDDLEFSNDCDQIAANSIKKITEVLTQLDDVLNVLIKYETQNELLDIVRKMIKDQQQLMDRTKKERQREAFEGLLDLQ